MPKLKFIFLLFIQVFFIETNGYSQLYYNSLDSVTHGIGTIVFIENSIYSNGRIYHGSQNISGTTLSKYNNVGDILQTDTMSFEPILTHSSRIENHNSKIVLFQNIILSPPYNNSDADCQISVLDTNFNTLWTSNFGGSNQETAVDVLTTDSAFYFLGASNSWDNGNGDVFVRKTDTLGNLIWQTEFGTDEADNARRILQVNDSLFLVSWTNLVTKHICSYRL